MHGTAIPMPPTRPALKWAGGKRWQIPHIRPLWEKYSDRRLVEPFCGGLAITLGLMPKRALLNDANPHLVNFYRWLKKGLRIEIQMENQESAFYLHRERFNVLVRSGKTNTREAASIFYYLNRTGFNGLCRFNQQGEFNVPFGRYQKINYTRDFTSYRPVFADWEISNVDVEGVEIKPDDFIYADPPYDVEFTAYSQGGFSLVDQQRTAAFLSKHPGPVVLVNQATKRIKDLYLKLGYSVEILDAPRRISCTGDRTPAREIIATRNV